MGKHWMTARILVLAVVLSAWTACAPGTPTATPTRTPQPTSTPAPARPVDSDQDVVGVWKAVGGGTLLLEFKADGTFVGQNTIGRVYDTGTFRLEGAQLVLESGENSICPGSRAVHEAYIVTRDNTAIKLELRTVDEPCWFRVEALADRTLTALQ